MPRDGTMFTSLRGKSQRPISSIPSEAPRANNTTNANSISLSAGNLIVGSYQSSRPYGQRNLEMNRATGSPAGNRSSGNQTLMNTSATSSTPIPVSTPNTGVKKNKSHQLELAYHESRYSNYSVMLNLSETPEIAEGDICELRTYHKVPGPSGRKIYFIARDFDAESKRRTKSSQVSVLSGQLQSLLDLPTRSKVWVQLKKRESCEADLVELHIKDCLLNRGDMWSLSSQSVGSCVFSGQKLSFLGSIRATVKGIYRDGKKRLSGYLGESTRIVFRSESARLIFLIQITDEMWNFEESGEQLFQKMVNSLFPKIFKRWKEIDTHHSITIAFVCSVDMSKVPFRDLKPGEILKNSTDYFRIVVDQVHAIHWVEIMETLRKEFMKLTKDILNKKTEEGHSAIKGRFSPVIKSNILESVNFATTILTDPFKQPDLRHTTTHVMIITPGSGLYDVDYDLLKLTGKKLLSLEMTMDLICLSRAPLHIVPLFRYLDYENKMYHCSPTWLSIFFWNDTSEGWFPRCKIYDLQMMGLTENDVMQDVSIERLQNEKQVRAISQLMDVYDDSVFRCKPAKEDTTGQSVKTSTGAKKPQSIDKSAQNNSPLEWNAPRFAGAVIEEAQKTKVLASMYTVNEDGEFDADGAGDSLSPIGTRGQTAVDTLKGITKKSSVKDLTHKIVGKLMPGWDQEAKKGKTNIDGINIAGERQLTTHTGLSNSKQLPGSGSNVGSSESTPIIMKTLDALSQHEKQRTISPVRDISMRESVSTVNSSKNGDSRQHHGRGRRANNGENKNKLVDSNWMEVSNPSMPVSSELAGQMLPVRWKDVLPRYVAKKYSKWRSFTTPAELPITISDFPTKEDFENNFIFRNHSVTLNVDHEAPDRTHRHLLRDMIYMRLLTGFQICVGKKAKMIELSKSQENKETPIAKYVDGDWATIKVYMMIDSEIHRLSCGVDGVIDVQRYLRKYEENPYEQVPTYIPLVKTRYESEYRPAELDPLHVTRESFNWNQIDQVLAGYGDCSSEKKKPYGYRSKMVVLPADVPSNTYSSVINGRNETLTPEEIRLEGLRKLITSINRSKRRTVKDNSARNNKKEEIQQEIMFYTGSLFQFIHEQKESLEKSAIDYKDSIFASDKMQLKKDADMKKVAYEMQHGNNPLTLVNRKWHWKKHQNSFIGAEMVNWLISNYGDIDTREDAVEYGQNLMEEGLFVHVLNKHSFLDGHYFYQLSPQYVIDQKSLEKVSSDDKSNANSRRVAKGDSISVSSGSKAAAPSIEFSVSNSQRSIQDESGIKNTDEISDKPTVVLSSSVVIDVDLAGKSYKSETCTVHYDKVHNPDHCFHIRVEWLTTTPKLLDDLVGNWSRLCERFGLKLIEIPWTELCTIPSINPFHSFVDIKLAINPWEDPEFKDLEVLATSKFYYHMFLLKASGFLLDNRAATFIQEGECEFDIVYSWGKPEFKYAQYIHNTGAYIAEIRENGNLFLAPNNIYLSRVNRGNVVGKSQSSPQWALDAQMVMLDFRETCTNYEKLREVLLEGKEKWIEEQFYDDF